MILPLALAESTVEQVPWVIRWIVSLGLLFLVGMIWLVLLAAFLSFWNRPPGESDTGIDSSLPDYPGTRAMRARPRDQ